MSSPPLTGRKRDRSELPPIDGAPNEAPPPTARQRTSSPEYDDKCSICDERPNAVTLPCMHRFCPECCRGHFDSCAERQQQPSCPLCRTAVSGVRVDGFPDSVTAEDLGRDRDEAQRAAPETLPAEALPLLRRRRRGVFRTFSARGRATFMHRVSEVDGDDAKLSIIEMKSQFSVPCSEAAEILSQFSSDEGRIAAFLKMRIHGCVDSLSSLFQDSSTKLVMFRFIESEYVPWNRG